MCIQLWQLDTIAVDDKEKALIALCEEQQSIIEDLRYKLGDAEKDRDSAQWDSDDYYRQLREMREERDGLKKKLDAILAAMGEYNDEMPRVTIHKINELL